MAGAVSRRGLIGGGLASLVASSLGASPRRERKPLRVVHLTDTHLHARGDAAVRFARCLDQIRNHVKPDLIIQGGDVIMDGLTRAKNDVASQFQLVERVLKEHVDVPIVHCIGNHDVFGWDRYDRDSLSGDPMFGKNMWKRFTGYTSSFFSFDRGPWHFVVIDSIGEGQHRGFTARIDEAQFEWLEKDLARTPVTTPVCMISHVPMLAVPGAQMFGPYENNGRHWMIPCGMVHQDARRLKDLLVRFQNVNLCLSGHVHMASRVDYNEVAHITSGAVSGAWWHGNMQETKPGYGVIELNSNGTIRHWYESYG